MKAHLSRHLRKDRQQTWTESHDHKRSVMKAITWRAVATLITYVVSYLLTGEVVLSMAIGFGDSIVKLIAYYSHERIWSRIDIRRKKAKEGYVI